MDTLKAEVTDYQELKVSEDKTLTVVTRLADPKAPMVAVYDQQ
jgi:hypothetical protein